MWKNSRNILKVIRAYCIISIHSETYHFISNHPLFEKLLRKSINSYPDMWERRRNDYCVYDPHKFYKHLLNNLDLEELIELEEFNKEYKNYVEGVQKLCGKIVEKFQN